MKAHAVISLASSVAAAAVDSVPTTFPGGGDCVTAEETRLQVIWDSGPTS